MAPNAKSPSHLVLKISESRQLGLEGLTQLRLPAAFRQMLEEACGTRCVIYIPSRAWQARREMEGHYIASGILDQTRADPADPSMLIVGLDGVQNVLRPVPIKIGDTYLATRDKYRLQDKSLEQREVVALDPSMFQQILGFGTKASVFIPRNQDNHAVDFAASPDTFGSGAGEDAPGEQRIQRTLERLTPPKRSKYVRMVTRLIDGGRCVACGFEARLGRRFAAVEVIHFHALAFGGPDTPANAALMCSRCHELHDGLCFTFTDAFTIIWSRHFRQVGNQQALMERAVFRRPSTLLPHPQSLRWHQARFEENEARLDQQS
jgi:hypothetical protein